MTPEGQDEGFEDVGSCEEDTVEASTDALNSVEVPPHQHQNANASNLDMRVHHHDLSQHNQHSLGGNNDHTNVVFPHQQHIQTHLNGLSSSTDANHITGSDLLQQHLLTQALHNQPSLHHPEQQHHHHLQYQQQHQLQQPEHLLHNLNHQTQQHPFSYHHDRHSSGVDENDSIVEATTALQHDVSVVDVGGMQEHAHPTDIPTMSEHHHPNNGISPSRLIQQEHEHQMALGMVYHQQFQQDTQQIQQQQPPQHQTREQEDSSSSVDPTQTVGMASSMFPTHNSPLTLPPHAFPQISKKSSSAPSRKGKKSATRTNKKAGIKESRVTDKKRKLQQKGITVSDRTSTGRGPLIDAKKPRRRRYDNNFKAEVLSHLKGPHTKLSDVARQYGIPENTLREWTKLNVVQAIESARSKNSGQLKANMYEPMRRLTETIMVFFDHNRGQPEHLRQSITTKLIVAKALEARSNLLQRHAAQPFLDPKEKKAIENFTGSDSWAKKFAKRRALKMTGARIKELSEEDINNFHYSLKQMSNRVRQAGPGYEESAMLIRQAAEKLLLASIIHSTACHRINVTPNNSRNERKKGRGSRSLLQSQHGDRQQQMDDQRSRVQPEIHFPRNALNLTSPAPD